MRDFKVGDKVECYQEIISKNDIFKGNGLVQGNIYTIENISNDYIMLNGAIGVSFHKSRFKLRLDLMRKEKLNQLGL